jgi:cytochrome c-type biogenesis protein CcsB
MSTGLSFAQWTTIADGFVVAGIACSIWSGIAHYRAARAGVRTASIAPKLALTALFGATALMLLAVIQRGIEVNHFPCQTMSEVLTMFSLALLVSMSALHYALGLHRRSDAWAIVHDAMMLVVLLGSFGTRFYMWSLSTAQRDLPPALQSYWFPPHISALTFSYATLAIAGSICVIYFCMRFWLGVFRGGVSTGKQVLTAAAMLLIPFAQIVTGPIFLATGAVFWWLARTKRLPELAAIPQLEKDLDEVSFRAFAVGMPFLTAGLWMGAFWAQEAWANYWGWDSKENSALITWLIYVVYIHLRMLGGYRGEKAMALLMGGTLSIFITFQLFGYLPDSQKSMHRYTDDNVVPREGMQGPQASTSSKTSQAPANASDATEKKGG